MTRSQLGYYEGALHDYTCALEIQPDALTHRYRGWIYLVQGAPKLALFDFDEAVRDPNQPTRLLPAYDSGDHLHVNDAGNVAQANAIPLSLFEGHQSNVSLQQ